jgi:hypothetical protein
MPVVDASAKAALGNQVLQPIYFLFADFVGSPARATTAERDWPFTGTGDADLDGFTYQAFGGGVLDCSDVINSESGSDTVTVTLSGILGIDTATLNLLGDRTKWFRRALRLWMMVRDENGGQQGAIIPFKSGWMTDIRIVPAPDSQTIEVDVETWRVLWGDASRRSYASQADYDSGDQSAAATIAAINAAGKGAGAATAVTGGGGNGEGLNYGAGNLVNFQ